MSLNSPPTDSLIFLPLILGRTLLLSWQLECGGSNAVWFLRLAHKREYGFPLALSFKILALGHHIMTDFQPYKVALGSLFGLIDPANVSADKLASTPRHVSGRVLRWIPTSSLLDESPNVEELCPAQFLTHRICGHNKCLLYITKFWGKLLYRHSNWIRFKWKKHKIKWSH